MADATTKSAVAEQVVANVTTAAPATTTPPQHGLHGTIQQHAHPPMVAQQPAVMAGSYPAATYPTATYPNVFYTAQSETVQFMQPQTQVSQLTKSANHF